MYITVVHYTRKVHGLHVCTLHYTLSLFKLSPAALAASAHKINQPPQQNHSNRKGTPRRPSISPPVRHATTPLLPPSSHATKPLPAPPAPHACFPVFRRSASSAPTGGSCGSLRPLRGGSPSIFQKGSSRQRGSLTSSFFGKKAAPACPLVVFSQGLCRSRLCVRVCVVVLALCMSGDVLGWTYCLYDPRLFRLDGCFGGCFSKSR